MMLFYLRLIFLYGFLLSAASEETKIMFPDFSTEENFITFGDAAHNTAKSSYIINAGATQSRGSCGALLCGKKVHIQDVATGRAASFSTSYSFTFTTHALPWNYSRNPKDGIGFFFAFVKDSTFAVMRDFVSEVGRLGACNSFLSGPNLNLQSSGFAFMIYTGYNPGQNMPSNNFIRMYKNLGYEYDISAYTHNLCGNDTQYCSYFLTGKNFTAWIDFNGSSHTLEVRLTNGSNPSVKKPVQPLLLIPNYQMTKEIGDDVHLTFWGSSAVNHVQTHELLSWSFFSSGIPESNSQDSSKSLLHFLKARTWAGITIGVLVTVSAMVILLSISRLARLSRYNRYTSLDYSSGPRVFSYTELRKATENFDERNLLGTGGSGSVYKGSLEGPSGGNFVAVKQINFSESKQAESLFHAEVSSLGQIRHRNVVQLQGWCQEKGRWLLVYNFMPNGGLNEWLHRGGSHFQPQNVLSLRMRLSILEGVGFALEYLHEDCQSCILHRDIKSSNVLLDADFKAHLGDFGLARLMDHHKLDKTTLAAGTLGYMAPEMPYTGKATKESDVYSFGMLMLEIVCGRRPLDMQAREPEDLMLLHIVWRAQEARSLLSVVDPRLLQTVQPSRSILLEDDETMYAIISPPVQSDSHNIIEHNIPVSIVVDVDIEVHKTMVVNILHLGLLCCLPNPKARPSMGQVNGLLQQIRDIESLSSITTIAMPSLPATKPLGLYQSLEFSQTAINSISSPPSPVSLSYAKSSIDSSTLQQALGSLHKDDYS